jgi:hypothetical protein
MPARNDCKAIRKQNREVRRMLRKEKISRFRAIVASANTTSITIDLDTAGPEFMNTFNPIWPIMKPLLEYAELVKITGKETEKVIRTLTDKGQRIFTGSSDSGEELIFINMIKTIWQPVKVVPGIVVTFTNDYADKVINDIIEIVDWITQTEDFDKFRNIEKHNFLNRRKFIFKIKAYEIRPNISCILSRIS